MVFRLAGGIRWIDRARWRGKGGLTGDVEAVEVRDGVHAGDACAASETAEQEDRAHSDLLSLGEHQVPDYEDW